MTIKSIKAKHPVREAFAGCSTGTDGTDYYDTKGHAVNAFDEVLQGFDLCFDRSDLMDFPGDSGSKTIYVQNVCDENDGCGDPVGWGVISWYRMDSGRYEFTGYLA
jgi:hypothetical protein